MPMGASVRPSQALPDNAALKRLKIYPARHSPETMEGRNNAVLFILFGGCLLALFRTPLGRVRILDQLQ
jgi:hypothetical protein